MAKAKIFVVHDDQGRIKATAVSALEHSLVKTSNGLRVPVIDHPGLDRKEMREHLTDLHRNHRVEVMGEPRIVPKHTKKG